MYDFKLINEVNAMTVVKCVGICCIFFKTSKLYVILVYRKPSASLDIFLEIMEQALTIVHGKGNLLVVGDFNVNFLSTTRECVEVCSLFSSFGLSQLVFEPTRGNNCLDNIFLSLDHHDCNLEVVETALSDHCGQLLDFLVPTSGNDPALVRSVFRPITQKGKCSFFSYVEGLKWEFLKDSDLSAEAKFFAFHNKLSKAFLHSFPEKSYKKRRDQSRLINWFNDDLKSMRETLYLLKEQYDEFPTLAQKTLLANHKKDYKLAIKSAKQRANDRWLSLATYG
uniref:Uncharacterized protein LOC114342711 n=1 Tax=Diabrotica virgifera virgifera TaxID=50390 RepID=A0A6P7GTF4_DIAVI